MNDIFVLDLKLMRWVDSELVKVSEIKPNGRYLHSATLVRSDMYIFGGKSHTDDIFGDLWVLNL